MPFDQVPPLTPDELELFLQRLRQRRRTQNPPAAPDDLSAPLSFGQKRVYVADRLAPDRSVYNMAMAFLVRGRLDTDVLRTSLDIIAARHESLRTAFRTEGASALQIVAPRVDIDLAECRACRDDLKATLKSEVSRPFRIDTAPLVRVLLVHLNDDERVLMSTFHHIVCDGWSTGVFWRELATLYQAGGSGSVLPPLSTQYRHYAAWQQQARNDGSAERHLAYWRSCLAGAPPFLAMPHVHRPAAISNRGACERRSLPEELTASLISLAVQRGATMFMVMVAALQVVLHHYSGRTDFLIESPVADRNLPGTENLIGYFVNVLASRADLAGDPSFEELLGRVRGAALEGLSRCDALVADVLEEGRAVPDSGQDVGILPVLTVRNEPLLPVAIEGMSLQPLAVEQDNVRGDFILNAEMRNRQLHWLLEYRTDLFDRDRVRSILARLEDTVRLVCIDAGVRVSGLCAQLATHDERDRRAQEARLASAATARLARLRQTARDVRA